MGQLTKNFWHELSQELTSPPGQTRKPVPPPEPNDTKHIYYFSQQQIPGTPGSQTDHRRQGSPDHRLYLEGAGGCERGATYTVRAVGGASGHKVIFRTRSRCIVSARLCASPAWASALSTRTRLVMRTISRPPRPRRASGLPRRRPRRRSGCHRRSDLRKRAGGASVGHCLSAICWDTDWEGDDQGVRHNFVRDGALIDKRTCTLSRRELTKGLTPRRYLPRQHELQAVQFGPGGPNRHQITSRWLFVQWSGVKPRLQ